MAKLARRGLRVSLNNQPKYSHSDEYALGSVLTSGKLLTWAQTYAQLDWHLGVSVRINVVEKSYTNSQVWFHSLQISSYLDTYTTD